MDMIGFIGMGNMGTAMLKGAKRTFDGSQIIFHRKSVDKMKKLAVKLRGETVKGSI